MKRFTLDKKSRLKREKSISEVFTRGKTIQVYPLRVYFAAQTGPVEGVPVKVAFAVPRKNFKRAVDRNRLKRQMREAYRLNQFLLRDRLPDNQLIHLVFLYFVREKLPYPVIGQAAQKILKRLAMEFQSNE